MFVQRNRQKLSQHEDLVDVAVDAIRNRNVDQALLRGQRHGRFGANLGQWIEPRSATTTKMSAQYRTRVDIEHVYFLGVSCISDRISTPSQNLPAKHLSAKIFRPNIFRPNIFRPSLGGWLSLAGFGNEAIAQSSPLMAF